MPPARHQIVAFVKLGQQRRDIGGIILRIAIHEYHDISLRVGQSGRHRRGLAEVALETQ